MIERVRVAITGAVQGVGFRPFIYRLALEHDLTGWVNNSAQGVLIEAEAPRTQLDAFLERIEQEKPPHAIIQTLQAQFLPPAGYERFEIHHSDGGGVKSAFILPDLALCPECLRELFDPANRRYRYPFINCTHCGPRFSIIQALPYDRPNTTMRGFPLCDACRAEYDNPLDRRFHAQPNACPQCGPRLALWDVRGETLAQRDDALRAAAIALRHGQIVAVKGLGGFQLMVDARRGEAIARLRTRKHREEKPLALMYPSLEAADDDCAIADLERVLLTSPEAPIVLLRRRGGAVAEAVAPGNPYLGVMLPYTPLHHLLMAELDFPLVATSGNLSGEPMCIDEREALIRLGGIADLLLVHDRPIARHVDDSIVRVAAGRELILRRARGYAPLPVELPREAPTLIAVGAHLKNAVAVSTGRQAFTSQHIGDMDTAGAVEAFTHVIADFRQLYELKPAGIVCDLHPDYQSTRFAEDSELPLLRVQHHEAHVLACAAEHHLEGSLLGVSWDGTGYGHDGTIWGGEFLRLCDGRFERFAHLQTFRLPGGDQAVKEPRRSALGLLYAVYGDILPAGLPPLAAFTAPELTLLRAALARGLNAPVTSSAGRLFDAVAALAGLRQRTAFEGQAAMALEFALDGVSCDEWYPFEMTDHTGSAYPGGRMIDLKPLVTALVEDVQHGVTAGIIAARFHNTLVEIIAAVAREADEQRVLLTGGCFQNRALLEGAVDRLTAEGFEVYWHQRVPPNDGGIAIGQLMAGMNHYVSGSTWENH